MEKKYNKFVIKSLKIRIREVSEDRKSTGEKGLGINLH